MSDAPYAVSGASSRSAAARADIEATRARMGDALEELGARLNPERLKQQAKDKIRDATIGRVQTMAQTTVDKAATTGRRVTDAVRENPIPAAMIAAGISWLAFSARRGGSSSATPPSRYQIEQSSYGRNDGDQGSSFGETRDSGIAETVRDKASGAVDRTQEIGQRAKEGAASVANTVTESARAQSDKLSSTFQENPLPLGLVGIALGLAAGFAIPSTQKEGELVGEKRDELVDKGRRMLRQKKEQAQTVANRVVTEAKSAATQAAREEGLTA